MRRSSGDLEGRGSTSARRSFFRRKKHQRTGSRDSKELATFCNISSGWYSDNGTLHEDLSLCSYQRVERLDCKWLFLCSVLQRKDFFVCVCRSGISSSFNFGSTS